MFQYNYHIILIILILINYIQYVESVWNRFDMVRNKLGSWGSKGNTSFIKINGLQGNGPKVKPFSFFGCSVANIGDLDGDGFDDLVVGAYGESSFLRTTDAEGANVPYGNQVNAGAVYILFMSERGDVKNYTRISGVIDGGPPLIANDYFGTAVVNIGDLDNDGVVDIVVSAPSYIIACAYILFLNVNGTVKSWRMIRGRYLLTSDPSGTNFSIPTGGYENGPPIWYGSKFGVSLANIGDFNLDGNTDIAVGQMDSSGGNCIVYLLYLLPDGTVSSYTGIQPSGTNGEPYIFMEFSFFGASILSIPDMDGDNVTELVISAKDETDGLTAHLKNGVFFICYMFENGTVKHYTRISRSSEESSKGITLPFRNNDQCGSAMTSIGDVNKDNYRQQHPDVRSTERLISIPDIIVGCPRALNDDGPGSINLIFIDENGGAHDYTEFPGETDRRDNVSPKLTNKDLFGAALTYYSDIDKNGIREIIVGAPGDSENGTMSGAIYVLFIRRRRYHRPYRCGYCVMLYTLAPSITFGLSCIIGTIYFFWYFRRKPSDVELMVKSSAIIITSKRTRVKKDFGGEGKVYADNYDA